MGLSPSATRLTLTPTLSRPVAAIGGRGGLEANARVSQFPPKSLLHGGGVPIILPALFMELGGRNRLFSNRPVFPNASACDCLRLTIGLSLRSAAVKEDLRCCVALGGMDA